MSRFSLPLQQLCHLPLLRGNLHSTWVQQQARCLPLHLRKHDAHSANPLRQVSAQVCYCACCQSKTAELTLLSSPYLQVLRLGNIVPDFTAVSTMGEIHWHDWIDGKWAILFSHPADFT